MDRLARRFQGAARGSIIREEMASYGAQGHPVSPEADQVKRLPFAHRRTVGQDVAPSSVLRRDELAGGDPQGDLSDIKILDQQRFPKAHRWPVNDTNRAAAAPLRRNVKPVGP